MCCDIPEEQLWSWVKRDAPELEEHLAGCPGCRARAEEIRARIEIIAAASTPRSRALPDKIAAYTVKRLLGEGGMGVVYEAEQASPRRAVALKVVRGGRYVDEHHVKLFQREAQALARLRHPSIGAIYEAGRTEDGQHFFAMELVRGRPLLEYVRAQKPSVRERLELFCKICEAINYAHQRGVMHRDLKPSNILIDAEGNPKILDFGLARITDADVAVTTTVTAVAQIIGTLSYMSPEQARGNPDEIDVRSDVYSLGVLLYELLTDELPYDLNRGMLHEAVRVICEDPPRRPSTILRAIRGDLETITLKALDKEPQRRYQSAAALAEDVERYLGDEPILARPPSAIYQFRKLVARHKLPVGFAATVFLLVTAFAVLATVQAVRIAEQRGRIVEERDRAHVAEMEAREAEAAEVAQRKLAEQRTREAEQARTEAEAEESRAKRAAERLRCTLYFNRIALAQSAYNENDIRRMNVLLEECPADLRGWEWYHLFWLSDRSKRSFRFPASHFWRMALSPDGNRVLLADVLNGVLKVLDIATGKELYSKEYSAPFCVRFSPDGRRISACGGRGGLGTPQVWDAITGDELLTLQIEGDKNWVGSCHSMAYSPGGEEILAGCRAVDGPGVLIMWDSANGEKLATFPAHEGPIWGVTFSPGGDRVISAGDDGLIKVWDAATNEELLSFRAHNESSVRLALSPDGKRLALAVGGEKIVRVRDATTGEELVALVGHTDAVSAAAFSPNGRWVVTGGEDNTVRVWDATTGDELTTLRGHEGRIDDVVFSPDGASVLSVCGSDDTLKVWDLETATGALTLPGGRGVVEAVAFGPDGSRIVSGRSSGAVEVWDTATGEQTVTLEGHEEPVNCVAWSPDGRLVASGAERGKTHLWDVASGQLVAVLDLGASSLAFSHDGKRLVSGLNPWVQLGGGLGPWARMQPALMRVWDVRSAKAVTATSDEGHIKSVHFNTDGTQILALDENGTLVVWDAGTGQRERTWDVQVRTANALAFSPEEKWIVSGAPDGTLEVWDAVSGEAILTLTGHTDEVLSVAFSPDRRRLVSGSKDTTIKIWDATTGHEALTLREHMSSVEAVGFTPDGRRIVSGSLGGTIKVWEAASEGAAAARLADRRAISEARARRRQTNRDAKTLVDSLFGELGAASKVIERLETAPSLAEPLRDSALRQAQDRGRGALTNAFFSWETVESPNGNIDAYRLALHNAQEALRVDPENLFYLRTLGVAQYRVGAYEDALVTLARSDQINHDADYAWKVGVMDHARYVGEVAFMAMAHYRLGHIEDAQAELKRLRELMHNSEGAKNTVLQAFLREAEELIEGAPSQPEPEHDEQETQP